MFDARREIARLKKEGVELSPTSDGKLHYRARFSPDDALRGWLKAHKYGLLWQLKFGGHGTAGN